MLLGNNFANNKKFVKVLIEESMKYELVNNVKFNTDRKNSDFGQLRKMINFLSESSNLEISPHNYLRKKVNDYLNIIFSKTG